MRYLLLISLLFCAISIPAQQDDTTSLFSVGLKAHRSFIIQHSEKLSDDVTSSNPWMIEAEFNWHLRRQSIWNYCNCYPRTGISIGYTDFGRRGILGEAIPLYAFIEPFLQTERRLNYSIRFGMGPAYMTTVYDESANPDNLFFSSRISFLVLLGASVNYRITPQITLRAGGSYNHISNGGISEPNLGINFPSLTLGADYSFRETRFQRRLPAPSKNLSGEKNRFIFSAGISVKPSRSGPGATRYPVLVAGMNYSRTVSRILALNAGAEWVTDRSIYHSLRESGGLQGDYPDHNRLGVLLGIDWLFGRFIFYQHFGVYLYAPVEALHPVYQRYGLSFMLTKQLFAGINIKAHGQDADFIDFRIGWSF